MIEMEEQIKRDADKLLEEISIVHEALRALEDAAEREMAAVREKYKNRIVELQYSMGVRSASLLDLMKKTKALLFDLGEKKDQVDLEHGILLYGKEDKVSIPRNALTKIEAQGWEEAIKTVKSVDREVVEKWPDEKLIIIGAKKKPKEVFSYELKNAKGEACKENKSR